MSLIWSSPSSRRRYDIRPSPGTVFFDRKNIYIYLHHNIHNAYIYKAGDFTGK